MPVFHLAKRLRHFGYRIVLHRPGNNILAFAEILRGQPRKDPGKFLENLPVGLGVPTRRYRLRQRMDKWVHVGCVQIILLIPGCGRQDNVGISAGGVEAEIDIHKQIQLACGPLVMPLDQLGVASIFALLHHTVLRAHQVLDEILVPLARSADQVAAPGEQIARPVDWIIRVGKRDIHCTGLEFFDNVFGNAGLVGGASLCGFIRQIERVDVPLRKVRRPAHAARCDVVVGQRVALVLVFSGRRQDICALDGFVTPLVGMEVKIGSSSHLARRTLPVEREGNRRPAGLRAQFFLTHIVCPAAARLTHAAAEMHQVHHATVGHVVVIPVAYRRAHDNHRFAVGLRSIQGKLAPGALQIHGLDAGDFGCPCRGIGHTGVVVVLGDIGAAQATVNTVLRNLHIEHRSNQHFLTIGKLQLAHWNIAEQHVVLAVCEVREADRNHRILAVDAGQFGQYFLLGGAILRQQIPFAFFAPAETDRAVWRDKRFGLFVINDGFPFRIIGLTQITRKIGSIQAAIGHIAIALLAQSHLNRQIGILARVFLKIRILLVDVELFQCDMPKRQEGCGIAAGIDRHPQVGKLDMFAIVGAHRNDFGAVVTRLDGEMAIRRTRGRQAGAAHDNVSGVIPVCRFGHVGLLTPGLRGGCRQVAIPVVK